MTEGTARGGQVRLTSVREEFPAVSREQWREAVEQELGGESFEQRLVTQSYEGIDIQPLYTQQDFPPEGDPSGFCGMPPFVRGSSTLANCRSGWDIRTEHSEPTSLALNEAILDELRNGTGSILIRLDRAARSCKSADEAAELIGRDGAILRRVADLDRALQGVDLGRVTVALDAGAAFVPAATMLCTVWTERGIDPSAARGAFNADPLGVLAQQGRLSGSLERALEQLGALAAWTSRNWPAATSVGVDSTPYHRAGATATQDLAFSMATGIEYLRAATTAGLDVDTAARQILFTCSIGCHLFLSIAKLRAARRLWARVVEASGGSEQAQRMRSHVRTSERVLTQRDPWVNLLRGTTTCFAAAVAGAESISVAPFDAALGLPDAFSRRIARNTQLILSEEAGLHRVIDPAGGSYFIEKLTEQLAEGAWDILQQIEARGGMAEALMSGWATMQIDTAWAVRLENIATRRAAITGVSDFANAQERRPEKEPLDYVALRLIEAQRTADRGPLSEEAARALARVRQLAAGKSAECELADAVAEAVAAGALIPEVCEALSSADEPACITPLRLRSYAKPFEELRDRSDAQLAERGWRPAVFLVELGTVAQHAARARYARSFFEAGGFEVRAGDGLGDAEAAARAFAESGAQIAVICSSDQLYAEGVVAETAPALREVGAKAIVLSGAPGDKEVAYREAGADHFIFSGCNVLGILRELMVEEGVVL